MTRLRKLAVPFVLVVLTSCSAAQVKTNFSQVFHRDLSDQQAERIAGIVNLFTDGHVLKLPGKTGDHRGHGDHGDHVPTTTAAPTTEAPTTEAPTTTTPAVNG